MTGLVFATFSKFIEIGNIVNKVPAEQPLEKELTRAQKRQQLEAQGIANNKRNRKNLAKEHEAQTEKRKAKHFSAVQNKPVYYADIAQFKNNIMMNVEVPLFWYIDPKQQQISKAELDYQ